LRSSELFSSHALFPPLRCGRKKDEFDYKALLENTVKDLLKVLFLPEFPAAEMLLFQLTAMLVSKIAICIKINAFGYSHVSYTFAFWKRDEESGVFSLST
jgi:hypothetical protein